MCDVYACVTQWDAARRIIDGHFVIEPESPSEPLVCCVLVIYTNGDTSFGRDVFSFDEAVPIRHYVSFEVAEDRLFSYRFGLDFTDDYSGESTAHAICEALQNHGEALEEALPHIPRLLPTIASTLQDLCSLLVLPQTIANMKAKMANNEEELPKIISRSDSASLGQLRRRIVEACDSLRDGELV